MKRLLALFCLATLAMGADQPVASHEQANPLYDALRKTGVKVTFKDHIPLPAPTMADGLDGPAQTAVVKKVIGDDYSYDEFVRESIVSPMVLKIRDLQPSDPKSPARGVDLYFIAFGNFDKLTDRQYTDQLLSASREGGTARSLSADELTKRGIDAKAIREGQEGYGHASFTFLDKVDLSLTGRSYWTRAHDSVLTASAIDPRFRDDRDFPNQWRPLMREGDKTKTGPPQPYDEAAQYVKLTRLFEPKGSVFVEYHVIFAEPVDWFGGANFLRSKFPPAAQKIVRDMRREFLKTK
ncbi:MAG: hypothetical protein ACJ8C4_02085 [Gemmataceae bacterium]